MNKQGFLGIDVSKGYADFLLLEGTKAVLEPCFRLDDTAAHHKYLGELIDGWIARGLDIIWCGVESTGGYENNWYHYLQGLSQSKPVKVTRLNPKGVKSVSDATLKRTITDQVSAENIATYLICFPEKIQYCGARGDVDSGFKDGRGHYNFIRMLTKQKVQINNQLEKLLYSHFNELLIYCRNGLPVWLLEMISRYPSAAAVKKAGVMNLSKISGITASKAEAILKKLGSNTKTVSDLAGYSIASMAEEIVYKDRQIKLQKGKLSRSLETNEEVKLITTLPGIGIDSAVGLMLEIEHVDRFESSKKLSSYFGVHPTFKQSGDGTWGNHMSKKGRSTVRGILYMSALTASRCNESLKQLYARKRASGFNHYQAIGVIMHKLLRMIYGILKNKTVFDIQVDIANKQKSIEKQAEKKIDAKNKPAKGLYRFKTASLDAPISRRKANKIKKQMTSQT